MDVALERNPVCIRKIRPEEGGRAVSIWRASVEATHHFLLPGDLEILDVKVRDFLPRASLWVVTDANDRPVGFMGLSGAHMDSLFIDPAWRGVGLGRALVHHALKFNSTLTTEVNEQNTQAVGFYERMGFVAIGRSPDDGEGLPYPLIHLRRESIGNNV